MVLFTINADRMTMSERLSHRVAQLAVTLLHVDAEGRITPVTLGPWIDEQVIDSPLFTRDVRERLPELIRGDFELIEIWPGVRLAPLPSPGPAGPWWMALFVGPNFLDSSQWREVCECGHMDPAYAAANVARETSRSRGRQTCRR